MKKSKALRKAVKFYSKNERILLPVAFLLFLLLFGVYAFILNQPKDTSMQGMQQGCFVEYGKGECIDNRLVVPFLNSGTKEIVSVKLEVPVFNGTDIFNVNQPLLPGKTGTLQLSECKNITSREKILMEYCCEKCYTAYLDNPSPGFTIIKGQ